MVAVTGWRTRLRTASFRGATFEVLDTSDTYGRRNVLHEYPQRDLPNVEDIGRAARRIKVTGYVIGENYLYDLDILTEAAEREGSGTLVHPYLGEMIVNCESMEVTQSSNEGRIARLSFTFVESGEPSFPAAVSSASVALQLTLDTVISATNENFAASLDTTGQGFIADDSIAHLTSVLNDVRSSISAFASDIGSVGDFLEGVDNLIVNAASLIFTPLVLAAAVASVLADAIVLGVMLGIIDATEDKQAITATSPSERQAQANRAAITAMIRRHAIGYLADAARSQDFTSYDDAIATRDKISDIIASELADDDLDDDSFDALQSLRTQMAEDITERSADLTRLVTYTPVAVTTTINIAQRLYADAERDAEISDRNGIEHPGFAEPVDLLVLSK